MKRIFAFLNLLLFISVLAGDAYYMEHGSLFVKGAVSSLFALLGAVNLGYALVSKSGVRYAAVMTAGLICAMLGDIFLGWNFIFGAGLFAAGHILYTFSFYSVSKPRRLDFILSAAMFALAVGIIKLTPSLSFDSPVLESVCLVYGLVISCMVGKAVSCFIRERSLFHAVIAVGSILFYFSDVMLVLNFFGGGGEITSTLCLLTYYPAQALLAHSTYQLIRKEHA